MIYIFAMSGVGIITIILIAVFFRQHQRRLRKNKKLEIMTKDKRTVNQSHYYESGIGMDG